MRLYTVAGTLDTRNDREDPRSGWYLQGEFERGEGTLDRIAPTTSDVRSQAMGAVQYSRALLDLRRYNRLGPGAQLNLRAVAGGWLNGDPLPLQRRFSVSGYDALPGFGFRGLRDDVADVGTCATGTEFAYAALGRPAQCERMLLLQAEWKGDFRVNLFGDDDDFGDRRFVTDRFSADGNWVVFVNSGRGWLLGDRGTLGAGTGRVPDTGTWRTDIGGGIDFGGFGVYVAQAVSESGRNPHVFVRLRHRF
jgi:outer membrane protein assembly factor BamA